MAVLLISMRSLTFLHSEENQAYINGTTTIGPFPPPKLFDLGVDDFISRMLANDPNCSTFCK